MADFIHGSDTKEIPLSSFPVQEIPSGIGALIGTAPSGPVNQMVLVKNLTEAAQFGPDVPGFTLFSALKTWFDEGGGHIIVVNVFSVPTMVTDVATETLTLINGKGRPANFAVSNLIVKNQGGTITHVKGTDYTVDQYGTIQSINNTTIPAGAILTLSYKKATAGAVLSPQIIGGIDSVTKIRTGLQLFDAAYNTFGFEAKIFYAPGFAHLAAVATELLIRAKASKGQALIDAPPGTTVGAALSSRGLSSSIPAFQVSDSDAILCFPELLAYDIFTDTNIAKPYSQFLAPVMARVRRERDLHWSPSNKDFLTVKGLAIEVSGSFFNPVGTDANELNNQGIVTVLKQGTFTRTWGNRSSAWPALSHPRNFIAVNAASRIFLRSIQLGVLPFIDMPNEPWVWDAILASGNTFIRAGIGRGVLIAGSRMFMDMSKNTYATLSLGKLILTIKWNIPGPIEHVQFEEDFDITLQPTENS